MFFLDMVFQVFRRSFSAGACFWRLTALSSLLRLYLVLFGLRYPFLFFLALVGSCEGPKNPWYNAVTGGRK